jgi:UDP-2,3-diacylglucosamine pyrophosphatase LpxH
MDGMANVSVSRGRSLFHAVFWTLTHVDDFLYALARGVWAVCVSHPERGVYPLLARLAAAEKPEGLRVRTLDRKERYVVVSDHHLLYASAPHDYFGNADCEDAFCNERIYAEMMTLYGGDGWVLVENGDVEDLVVPEPSVDRWGGLAEGAWGRALFDLDAMTRKVFGGTSLRERSRLRQLRRIAGTYAGYYKHLVEQFGVHRIVKLVGNHDAELLRSEFAEHLPLTREGVTIDEFAVIPAGDGQPAVVICHGHQMDPWTCQATRAVIGESITESFSWLGQGADRIWYTSAWGPPLRSTNELSALSIASFSGLVPKVRHMSERRMHKNLTRQFPDLGARPWVILGHTHEPRFRPRERYANAAAAGRYQDLVWAVEIEKGIPKLVAWWLERLGAEEHLVRGEVAAVGDWLKVVNRKVVGHLPVLPYGGRPTTLAALDQQIRLERPSYTWWWLGMRILTHLVFLGGFVWVLVAFGLWVSELARGG